VVQAGEIDRVSEGLRAGLGLGLRGDEVVVALTGAAARHAENPADPRVARALRTLAELGRPARVVGDDELAVLVERARAVEVWSSGSRSHGSPRRLLIGGRELEIWPGAPRFRAKRSAIDAADLVAQIFESDGPVFVR